MLLLILTEGGIQKADYIVYGWGQSRGNVVEWYHRELTPRILKTVERFGKKHFRLYKYTG